MFGRFCTIVERWRWEIAWIYLRCHQQYSSAFAFISSAHDANPFIIFLHRANWTLITLVHTFHREEVPKTILLVSRQKIDEKITTSPSNHRFPHHLSSNRLSPHISEFIVIGITITLKGGCDVCLFLPQRCALSQLCLLYYLIATTVNSSP
jgi:hypothetical protein